MSNLYYKYDILYSISKFTFRTEYFLGQQSDNVLSLVAKNVRKLN